MEAYINQLKRCSRLKPDECGFINIKFTSGALEEIINYLEEFNSLRVELEKNSKQKAREEERIDFIRDWHDQYL